MFSAVVFSAGRTASMLISENLSTYYNVPVLEKDKEYESNTHFPKEIVIHTHNPNFILPSENCFAIVSSRRDVFTALVSISFATQIQKFHYFPIDEIKGIDSIRIDNKVFEKNYNFYKNFYRTINERSFSKRIDICYEDLISDPMHLFSHFNIEHPLVHTTLKTPHDYTKVVINYKELKELYNNLNLQYNNI
jgi:hypothetical protein